MTTRRSFIKSSLASLGVLIPLPNFGKGGMSGNGADRPIVVSTWGFGQPANEAAWEVLGNNGSSIDAVEQGVRVPEGDPDVQTVGFGGYPDRDGEVTLDACIQDQNGDAGSVTFLRHIKHPVSVARKVKEESPHVMLTGEGALEFALDRGFEKEDLLTDESRQAWKEWLEKSDYDPDAPPVGHDTIGMLALDGDGNLSGACTTSGLAYKWHGRVADSALIGCGLFVDNEVGAACATGVGEEIIKVAGSHAVVERMREGDHPEEACRKVVERVLNRNPDFEESDQQVAFLALNKNGEYGGYGVKKGFSFAVHDHSVNRMVDASFAVSGK